MPQTHLDLWSKIKTYLVARSPTSNVCYKVKAHAFNASFQQASWLTHCNHIVDELAKIANLRRPQFILDAWSKLDKHYTLQRKASKIIFSHLISTFRLGEAADNKADEDVQVVIPEASSSLSVPREIHVSDPVFKKVLLPKTADLIPMFVMGPLWGH
jgi:hypothetical protein